MSQRACSQTVQTPAFPALGCSVMTAIKTTSTKKTLA